MSCEYSSICFNMIYLWRLRNVNFPGLQSPWDLSSLQDQKSIPRRSRQFYSDQCPGIGSSFNASWDLPTFIDSSFETSVRLLLHWMHSQRSLSVLISTRFKCYWWYALSTVLLQYSNCPSVGQKESYLDITIFIILALYTNTIDLKFKKKLKRLDVADFL